MVIRKRPKRPNFKRWATLVGVAVACLAASDPETRQQALTLLTVFLR
jgi:hypothetical protein